MKKIVPILLIINMILFVISLSLSFTILFRPFYYLHINGLDLPKETGFNYEEIKEAYDDIIDYTVFHKEFSTGVLKHSNDGISHFKDCQTLFMINFVILGITSIVLILKRKYFKDIKLFNYNISFWSSIILLTIFVLLLIVTIIFGFDKIFTIFHNIIFLGKDNWLFDPNKDEIIKVLPHRYFINCGLLIITIISTISITFIVKELLNKRKK